MSGDRCYGTANHSREVGDLARSIFTEQASTDAAGFDAALWDVLAETGLTLLTLPEDAGGSGGDLADAGAVLLEAGDHAAAVPLAETDLLAGWLLHSGGLAVPAGPLAAAASPPQLAVERDGDGWAVRGTLPRVGWARCATGFALLAPTQVFALQPGDYEVGHGHNLAGEPRDTVAVNAVVPVARVGEVTEDTGGQLRLRAALGRALLLAGAAQRALTQTVSYASEREQFGRPIGRFQAVQQQIAAMAGEVAAGRAAADAAVRTAATRGIGASDAALAVAMAKARTSEAATAVARIAHQP